MNTLINLNRNIEPDEHSPVAPNESQQTWQLSPGSHLAIATDATAIVTPIAVASGSFVVDHITSNGRLSIEFLDGGSLHGVATRTAHDDLAMTLWMVRGTLTRHGCGTPVTLALRDHGVIARSGTWWWLSGTGGTPRCGRQRRRQFGSPVVADILLTR